MSTCILYTLHVCVRMCVCVCGFGCEGKWMYIFMLYIVRVYWCVHVCVCMCVCVSVCVCVYVCVCAKCSMFSGDEKCLCVCSSDVLVLQVSEQNSLTPCAAGRP